MLERLEVLAKLQGIFRQIFDEDGLILSGDTTSNDIPEWDSLSQIKIILSCERVFNIRLRPREINSLENVDEMVDHLCRAINAK